MAQICTVEIPATVITGIAKNVIACPATSSATTCPGSLFPVSAITVGANLTQMTDATIADTSITMEVDRTDMPKYSISANMIVGGIEPQVPGAIGNRPRPKHDVSKFFIVIES